MMSSENRFTLFGIMVQAPVCSAAWAFPRQLIDYIRLFFWPMANKWALDHSRFVFACVHCKIAACFLSRKRPYSNHLRGAFSSH